MKAPEELPISAMVRGRFCAYFAISPIDKNPLGPPSAATTTTVFIAIAALTRGNFVAWEKIFQETIENPNARSRPVNARQRLSTVGGPDSIISVIRPAMPSKGLEKVRIWFC